MILEALLLTGSFVIKNKGQRFFTPLTLKGEGEGDIAPRVGLEPTTNRLTAGRSTD